MVGFLLIIVGVIFLLKNLGVISGSVWEILWPVLFIATGLGFVARRSSGGLFWKERFGWRRREIEKER